MVKLPDFKDQRLLFGIVVIWLILNFAATMFGHRGLDDKLTFIASAYTAHPANVDCSTRTPLLYP